VLVGADRRCWGKATERVRRVCQVEWRRRSDQGADREANGTIQRIAGAHFPDVKTLEDFNTNQQPSLRRDILAHLASTSFVAKAENLILLGPPGVGNTHLAIALGIKAVQANYPLLFDSATNWINRFTTAHATGGFEQEGI
jgi:DNA replication protein DnaC